MINKFKSLSPLVKFLIKFISLLLLWEFVYTVWVEPQGILDFKLTSWVSESSLYFLNLLGYKMTSVVGIGECQVIHYEGVRLLHVAHPCNGLILQVLFVTFLLCFPGDYLIKSITIFIGCLGIYLINVFRVSALLLIKMRYPQYLDFSHKWLFTIIVYSFVFLLWMLWVNRLSKISLNK